jgi:hypothetical protein
MDVQGCVLLVLMKTFARTRTIYTGLNQHHEIASKQYANGKVKGNNLLVTGLIQLDGLKLWTNGLCMVPVRTKRMNDRAAPKYTKK